MPAIMPVTRLQRASRDQVSNPYDATFALCYLANTALMVAISLLFRYADFVRYFGGSEMQLGLIVGVGMVGAVLMRIFQGIGIDRFGPRIVWLGSVALFVASLLAHLAITRIDSPLVFVLRIIFMIAVSGAFGASITFVSLRAPPGRMAEMIGVLGSSGFIGIATGPTLGDWIFRNATPTLPEIHAMFLWAAGMGLLALICLIVATWHAAPRPVRRLPPVIPVLRRYHPGPLLLMSVAMGLGVQLPNIFLRPFAVELGIHGIRSFFLVYAAAAFVIRLATRRWTDRAGSRPVALVGMCCLATSMLLYLPVEHHWHLMLPAVLAGISHAFLFPAVVSGGTFAFPTRYRGLATTLMLTMFDAGVLIGQPAIGWMIHFSRAQGWPAYNAMFVCVAGLLFATAGYYAWASGQAAHAAPQHRRGRVGPPGNSPSERA